MGLGVGIFRNFGTVFGQFGLNFQDCFQTIRAEFLGLFSGSPYRIFGTVFGRYRTVLRFGFDPETDVFRFCGVFWYHSNSVTNREGTKRCPVLYGSEILAILFVLLKK